MERQKEGAWERGKKEKRDRRRADERDSGWEKGNEGGQEDRCSVEMWERGREG